MQQPQEIEVWYILPAIRRELAKIIVQKHGLSGKETARILDVTEPAISQYKKSKRAKEVEFTKETLAKIEEGAAKVIKDNTALVEVMQDLCDSVKRDLTLCKIHKSKTDNIPNKCKVCIERLK